MKESNVAVDPPDILNLDGIGKGESDYKIKAQSYINTLLLKV